MLVEIAVGCWLGLLRTTEHGPPCPKCIIWGLDLKYPKDITGTFKNSLFSEGLLA